MDRHRFGRALTVVVLASLGCARGCDRGPAPRLRSFRLTAAPTTLSLIDGRPLEVWAYNGRVPGPTLRVRQGDTVRVHFTNRLPQPTTVHWHGVRVPNRMDGVPGVTQPPIAPGKSFVYEFVARDAGTFWFHPHVRSSEQVERGLFGVLVVEERSPPPFSREIVWVVDDWLLGPDRQLVTTFNTRHDLAHDGRWGNVVTINGRQDATEHVAPGERIRLRIVNVANGRVFTPDLATVPATVIAFDGLPTDRPLPATGLELAPGNRVDLDLRIPASLAGRTVTIADRFGADGRTLGHLVVAEEPRPARPFDLALGSPFPRWREAASAPPTEVLQLDARAGGPYGIEWTINQTAFRHDDSGAHAHHEPAYQLALGWAKLRFVNASARLHPMHLHGQFFYVTARNGRPVDEDHWRDTVLVHPRETVDVAVSVQDAGLWMLHCHILEHAESGMMTLIEVR